MKKVTLLMLEQSSLAGMTVIMDIFRTAGVSWNEAAGVETKRLFNVEVVALDKKPLRYSGAVSVTPHKHIDDVMSTDLLVVPSSGIRIEGMKNYPHKVLEWIQYHGKRGTDVAGICTGVFLLAESGLLNGRMATTHWVYSSMFKRRYPKVDFRPERLMTKDGNIFCSGGSSAGMDLCLSMVEKYYGTEVADQCAKMLLIERGRDIQTPYEVFRFKKKHQDEEILQVQNWLETCFSRNIKIDDFASHVGMSIRNFKRRFKLATGDPPIVYLQKLRIDAAKKKLEFGNRRIEEIASQVGYEDVGFFRKLFVRYTGISPQNYRQKYNL